MKIALLVGMIAMLAGCATQPRSGLGSGDEPLARRAALFRGAVESQWDAVRATHDRGGRLDSRYVFALAELRTGAIRSELEARFENRAGRAEAENWLAEAEGVLTALLAVRLTPEATAEAASAVDDVPER